MPQKIMIVDDEKDIVEMLKYNLEKEGYQRVDIGHTILRRHGNNVKHSALACSCAGCDFLCLLTGVSSLGF